VGCKINDRNEREEVTEEIYKIRYEIQVIIENDGLERGFLGDELVDIFRKVENNDDHDQQRNGIEKRTQEFFNDIVIDGPHGYFS
jgi:hypothetical protein